MKLSDKDYANILRGVVDLVRDYKPQQADKPIFGHPQTGMNISLFGHYGNTKPFNNLALCSARGWMAGAAWDEYVYTDPRTMQLHGIPPETEIDLWRIIVQVRDVGGHYNLTRLRPGNWHLFWDGPCNASLVGEFLIGGKLVEKNHYVVEASANVDEWSNPSINIWVTNPTKGKADFTKWAIIHEEDLGNKDLFNHQWVGSLLQPKGFRIMDWTMTPALGFDDYGKETVALFEPENFYTKDSQVWTIDNQRKWLPPPYAIGELARATNADAMLSLPFKFSERSHRFFRDEFTKAAGSNYEGLIILESGDEGWNVAWPWGVSMAAAVARIAPYIKVVDVDGKPSNWIIDQQGCVVAHTAIQIWRIWGETYPRNRLAHCLCGQMMAGTNTSGMGGMFKYVDPTTGKTAAELADLYGLACYWGPHDLTLQQALDQRAWDWDDEQWIDRAIQNIDEYLIPGLVRNQEMLGLQAPNLRLTMYEGGGYFLPEGNSSDPNYDKLTERCVELIDGQAGKVLEQYFWDKFVLRGDFAYYMHFNSHDRTYNSQIGMVFNPFEEDTPREALFRTLG